MQKFRISHYQKANSIFMVSASFGARLLITDTQYIVKFFFRKVATFEIDKTTVTPISFITKGVRLSDGDKSIDLYFLPKTARKVYNLLGIS